MRYFVLIAIVTFLLTAMACAHTPPGGQDVYCYKSFYDPPGHWNEMTIYTEHEPVSRAGWRFFESAEVDWPGNQRRNFGELNFALPDDEYLTIAPRCRP